MDITNNHLLLNAAALRFGNQKYEYVAVQNLVDPLFIYIYNKNKWKSG